MQLGLRRSRSLQRLRRQSRRILRPVRRLGGGEGLQHLGHRGIAHLGHSRGRLPRLSRHRAVDYSRQAVLLFFQCVSLATTSCCRSNLLPSADEPKEVFFFIWKVCFVKRLADVNRFVRPAVCHVTKGNNAVFLIGRRNIVWRRESIRCRAKKRSRERFYV